MNVSNTNLLQHLTGASFTENGDLDTLKKLCNLLPFPVTLHAPGGSLLFASNTWLQLTGAPEPEALLNNWQLYIHPADQEAAAALFGHNDTAGENAFEFRLRHHDGDFKWLLAQPAPVHSAGGEHLFTLTICTQIQEQKQLERRLLQKEERLSLAMEVANLGIFDYDIVTDTTIINETAREMYELEPGQPFGFADFISRVHPDDREAVTLNNYNIISNPDAPLTYRNSFRVVRSNGQVRWYANLGRIYVNEQGLRYRVLGTILDETAEKEAYETLRYKEEKLRLASEATGTAWWHNDLKRGQLTSSPLLNTIFGLEASQPFTLNDFVQALHPDDREEVMNLNTELMQGLTDKDDYKTTYRIVRPDGEVRWISALGKIFRDGFGQPDRFVGTAQDVTPQVESAALVAASERKLSTIADAAPVALWMTDNTGQPVFANKAWYEWSGKTEAELKAEGILGCTVAEDKVQTLMAFNAAVSRQQLLTLEHRIANTSGEVRWVLTEARPYFDAQGGFAGYVGSGADITTRKLAEISLQESEFRFRQLADSVPLVVWTATPDGETDYFNQRWQEFTGHAAPHGDPRWVEVLHPEDRQHCLDVWFNAVRQGQPYEIEYRWWHTPTGKYRWVLGKAIPLRDEQGRITKWLGTGTDIHDARNMAEALEEAVQRRTLEYQRLNASLQRSNEDLQHFAHVASHDLKEPLRKIKLFSDQLLHRTAAQLAEPSRELLHKIIHAANRMSVMVDGILHYSIIGGNASELELINLNDLLQQVQVDQELRISQQQASITLHNLPQLEGHPILLQQLFDNLVGNALKFGQPGTPPRIQVVASLLSPEVYQRFPQLNPRLTYCQVMVADNGIGFRKESAEKIFDVFHRLHPRNVYDGTGLGLALCRKIVQRHSGHIYAESAPGDGARFYVILPLQQPRDKW